MEGTSHRAQKPADEDIHLKPNHGGYVKIPYHPGMHTVWLTKKCRWIYFCPQCRVDIEVEDIDKHECLDPRVKAYWEA